MSHVYELRMYTPNPGKLDAIAARFRDHAAPVLPRHNMKCIGCWTIQEPNKTLFVYIIEHESREAAAKNWDGFRADADWKQAKAASEVDGPLIASAEHYFMDPTAFSAIK